MGEITGQQKSKKLMLTSFPQHMNQIVVFYGLGYLAGTWFIGKTESLLDLTCWFLQSQGICCQCISPLASLCRGFPEFSLNPLYLFNSCAYSYSSYPFYQNFSLNRYKQIDKKMKYICYPVWNMDLILRKKHITKAEGADIIIGMATFKTDLRLDLTLAQR